MPVENLPSNSYSKKRGEDDLPSIKDSPKKKVIKGNLVERKKPLLARIFGENTKFVGNYILWDVLIPAAKNTISEIISNGIEMLLYGETRKHVQRDRGRSYVSYSGFYKEGGRQGRDVRDPAPRNRNRHTFDDIVLDRRSDAEEVLSNLVDLIDDYGEATVADFYDLVGLNGEWSDNKYGWDNLGRATVKRVREGYILDLPRPVSLD